MLPGLPKFFSNAIIEKNFYRRFDWLICRLKPHFISLSLGRTRLQNPRTLLIMRPAKTFSSRRAGRDPFL